MKTKTCSVCKEVKPVEEFKLTRHGNPGGKCTVCHLRQNNEYRAIQRQGSTKGKAPPVFDPLLATWLQSRPMRYNMCGRVYGHPTGVTYASD